MAVMLLLASCAASSQLARTQQTSDNFRRFTAAVQDALDCRATVAGNPGYLILSRHMPLTDPSAATLPQLADRSLATPEEAAALDLWTREVNACRERLLQVADATLPSFRPLIEAGQNDDAAVFVLLVQRRVTWGDAVMRLQRSRTKLEIAVVERADTILAELSAQQTEQLNRRTTILSSVIRILP